jgi:hypothetical protein
LEYISLSGPLVLLSVSPFVQPTWSEFGRYGVMEATSTGLADASPRVTDLSSNPLWNLPADDPRCTNGSCLAYIYGWLEDQDRYNSDQFKLFAQWTTYFYCTVVALFAVIFFTRLMGDKGKGTRLKERCLACWRMFFYRRLSGKMGQRVDLSYGQLSLLVIATIFLAFLPFYQGYYLRALFRYGSPPLSVRCAMVISGLLPILMALAGKVNIVTLLTGISYAKLNLYHRYVAFMIYGLTIIHLVCLLALNFRS